MARKANTAASWRSEAKVRDISDPESGGVLDNPLETVTRLNHALLDHAEVESGALAGQEPPEHVCTIEANRQLEQFQRDRLVFVSS